MKTETIANVFDDRTTDPHCTAFQGDVKIASGLLSQVAVVVKDAYDKDNSSTLLIFDDTTGKFIDLELHLPADELQRIIRNRVESEIVTTPEAASTGPGRPRLGVVAREVTLLPRHWQWLNGQPGGASVALRKLVENARKTNADADRRRQAQEACYRFISTMAGDRPGFEEASRALFAGNSQRFGDLISSWPTDILHYAHQLSLGAFIAGDSG